MRSRRRIRTGYKYRDHGYYVIKDKSSYRTVWSIYITIAIIYTYNYVYIRKRLQGHLICNNIKRFEHFACLVILKMQAFTRISI